MTTDTDARYKRRLTITNDRGTSHRTAHASDGPCGALITTGPTFNPLPAVGLTVYPDGSYEVHEVTRAGLTNIVATGIVIP